MSDAAMPNLVLVPGLLCTAELFAPQIAALGDVARITVADHGVEDDMEAIAADVLAAAPMEFALAGLSMGGYIAFEILRQAPGRVTRLALIDTSARGDRPEQTAQRRELITLAEEKGIAAVGEALRPYLMAPGRQQDARLLAILKRMTEETGLEVFKRQQEAIIGRPDNRPFLAEIDVPTVVIVGELDQMTPVKVAREMADAIPGARLEVIPGAGHLPTLETPEAVNDILRDWLTADAGGAAAGDAASP
ncbi:MAG: alpha/beta fold hydrolase [Hyphomicrobiaceae bacterium]